MICAYDHVIWQNVILGIRNIKQMFFGLVLGACSGGSGEATYYDGNGGFGSCGSPLTSGLYGAISHSCYEASQCGKCAVVHGPLGNVTITIMDKCPGCLENTLDISSEAFKTIATIDDGRVKVTWELVECNNSKPISQMTTTQANLTNNPSQTQTQPTTDLTTYQSTTIEPVTTQKPLDSQSNLKKSMENEESNSFTISVSITVMCIINIM